MARPQKKGLDYFPLDVNIFEDDKLFDVSNEYGPLGEVIYVRLLCLIYKNGYYYKFESLDKLVLMLIKSIGNRWVRDKKVVSDVIPFLAKCNLFSTELMQENVLTSQSIQKRFQKANERNQPRKNLPYWLIDENGDGLISVPQNDVNVYNNSINVDNNSENVNNNPPNKIKEKEKDIKVDLLPEAKASSPPQIQIIFPLRDTTTYPIYDIQVTEWKALYPAVDVMQELRKMKGWLDGNPNKRKTNSGIPRFVTSWLSKEQTTLGNQPLKEHSYDLDKFDKLALNYTPKIETERNGK